MTTTAIRPRLWTSTEVCWFAGISYRQLHLWVVKGYLTPDNPHPGSGHDRRWPEHEVVKAVAMANMVWDGISHAKAAQLVADSQRATLLIEPLPRTLA